MKETRSASVRLFLPLIAALFLMILFLAKPWQVRAGDARLDGGGLPTRTRTPTRQSAPLPPTITPTPTEESIFPPTATMTLPPGGLLEEQSAAANAQVARQEASRFSLLSCWPFGLIIVLILIIGVVLLSSRLRQPSA